MQLDLFDIMYDNFRFETPIKTLTLFSGIGFQEMGMDLAEIPYEMVGTSEIDKFAILSYAAIHADYLKIRNDYDFPGKKEMVEYLQERNVGINLKTQKQTITNSTNIETVKDFYLACVLNKNFGDISKLNGKDIKSEIDLMTYSFPCQDLSKAGQQAGLSCGTRSGLVYEVLRILHELKEQDNLPKVLIMENVIDLIQSKFVDEWSKIALEIEQMGYTNFTQELNGRDYGIAQNRRRVFMVSVLGDYNYNFPRKVDLKYRLKDYLEDEVDEKYYLSDKLLKTFTDMTDRNGFVRGERFKPHDKDSEYGYTVTTKAGQRATDNFIKISEATKKGYKEAYDGDGVYINRPHQKRGVVQDGMIQTLKTSGNDVGVVVNAKKELCNKLIEQGLVEEMDMIRHSYTNNRMEDLSRKENENNMSATLTTRPDTLGVAVNENGLRIRKLTPTETGRLMGMQDYQIERQRKVTSNAQMYKQHGNGIIAQVMALIIGMMWYEDEQELQQKTFKNSFKWTEE